MKFDLAISLGLNCQSSYHILRTLYLRKFGSTTGFSIWTARDSGLGRGRCFFDWAVTPERALLHLLKQQFEGTFQPRNMRLKQLDNGKQTVVDDISGCTFPHDFAANRGNSLTQEDVLAVLPEVQDRYDRIKVYTINLMRSANAKLYVLYGNLSSDGLIDLFQMLDRYDENYSILLLETKNRDGQELQHLPLHYRDRLITRQIRQQAYPGNIEDWEKAFNGIELALSP